MTHVKGHTENHLDAAKKDVKSAAADIVEAAKEKIHGAVEAVQEKAVDAVDKVHESAHKDDFKK